ncbi:MAG: hypothetical protein F6K19_50375 [Cyanothece sp. SIO1E1]|nr:hypothetical protein [Cyanothece sp. SIO1E1]
MDKVEFRSVYATIAEFWYCPPQVDSTEFKATIQGHYKITQEKNPELVRSLAASRHYSTFVIADSVIAYHKGKRKGIKLGYGGIKPIDAFKEAAIAPSSSIQPSKQRSGIHIWKGDRSRLQAILEQLDITGGNQQDRFAALLTQVEQWLAEGINSTQEVPPTPQPPGELHQTAQEVLGAGPQVDNSEGAEANALLSTMTQMMGKIGDLIEFFSHSQEVEQVEVVEPEVEASESDSATTSTPEKGLRQLNAERMRENVNQAIDAIFAHNNHPGRLHDEKWAISINALKAFCSSQKRILEVLELRQAEIDAHHSQHQIDSDKHNLRHRRRRTIDQVISLVDAGSHQVAG